MTKFECAVDYAWSCSDNGVCPEHIAACMNVGSEAIDLLREFYDNTQSMAVPCFNLFNEDDKKRLIKFVES